MKTIVAMLAIAFFVALPSRGQGTLQTYAAIAPGQGEPTAVAFAQNMIASMRGTSLAPVPFLPNGATVNATNAMTFDPNGTGSVVVIGFHLTMANPFFINQIGRESWTQAGANTSGLTNTITSSSFGPSVVGIKWGPAGPGDESTVYSSGSTAGVALNELYMIGNSYTFRLNAGATYEQGLASFNGLYGPSISYNARYYLGAVAGHGVVNLAVPEPSVLALIGLSAALFWQKRRQFDL